MTRTIGMLAECGFAFSVSFVAVNRYSFCCLQVIVAAILFSDVNRKGFSSEYKISNKLLKTTPFQ